MNKNQVNQNIQSRVKNFLQFNIKNEQSEDQDVDLLISQLPETLKAEMLEEIQTLLINKFHLLKSNFSKDLLIVLSKKVIRLKFSPGDLIVKQNDLQNNKIYFIIEGKVNLVEENSKKVFQKVKAYQCFNEYSFFTGFAPKFSARSLEYTEVIIIDRNEMIEQLVGLQKDRERFHMIKDQILLENCYVQIQLKCFFCGKYNHQSIDCKMIQYKPDIEQLQKKMYFNNRQERGQFKRMKDKDNTLALQNNVHESILKFKQERMELNQDELFQTLNSKMKSSQIHNQSSMNKIVSLQNFEQQLRFKKSVQNTQQLDENRINQSFFAKYDKILKTSTNINLDKGSLLELQIPNKTENFDKCEDSQLEEFMIPQLFHSTIIDLGRNYKYYYPKQNSQEVISWLNYEEKQRHFSNYTYNFNQLQKIVQCKKS